MIGNARARVVIEEDEKVVIKRENIRYFVYREMADLSSPGYFNYDCPRSFAHWVLNRGRVDMQMNNESNR